MPSRVTSRDASRTRWYEPLLLAGAAAVAATPALHWAGVRWRTSAVLGAAAFVLVAVACWIASTVSGPAPTPPERVEASAPRPPHRADARPSPPHLEPTARPRRSRRR
ncbi:hypothetical protein [Cellulomonas soli]